MLRAMAQDGKTWGIGWDRRIAGCDPIRHAGRDSLVELSPPEHAWCSKLPCSLCRRAAGRSTDQRLLRLIRILLETARPLFSPLWRGVKVVPSASTSRSSVSPSLVPAARFLRTPYRCDFPRLGRFAQAGRPDKYPTVGYTGDARMRTNHNRGLPQPPFR